MNDGLHLYITPGIFVTVFHLTLKSPLVHICYEHNLYENNSFIMKVLFLDFGCIFL